MHVTACLLLFAAILAGDNLLIPPAEYRPKLPDGAWKYTPAKYTQRIATTNGRPTIRAVPISAMPDTRWHASGGLLGVKGWRSEKWKWTPRPEREWVAGIVVLNSFNNYQTELGMVRTYPVGTEFHDVLYNEKSGKVFEHRVRKKEADGWDSHVEYRDEKERPPGYTGLKVSCASCHREAGTGGYAVGLVPGGDTVLSDPWDWTIARGY